MADFSHIISATDVEAELFRTTVHTVSESRKLKLDLQPVKRHVPAKIKIEVIPTPPIKVYVSKIILCRYF